MVAGMSLLTPFPLPQINEVLIHCAILANGTGRHASPEELRRADQLRDPLKRNCYLARREWLREILGRYLGISPEELKVSEGEHGKPYLLDNATTHHQPHFNLSHSGSVTLLAIAADREVGIDLEQIRTDASFSDVARLAFSRREQEKLFALPDHLQRIAFYRCWTRKEAYLKACGTGFSQHSSSFDVVSPPGSTSALIYPDPLSEWHLLDINVPEGYCAALATKGLQPTIRYID